MPPTQQTSSDCDGPMFRPSRRNSSSADYATVIATIAMVDAMVAKVQKLPRLITDDTHCTDADDVIAHLLDARADLVATLALVREALS